MSAMNRPAPRTIALAAVATGAVAILALSNLLETPEPTSETTSDTPTRATGPVPGAPPGMSQGELEQRYDPILDAGLFTKRSFLPKVKRVKRDTNRAPTQRKPTSTEISLRLTGLIGIGAARRGVLEERGTGRGILAAAGERLGTTEVVSVNTSTVVVVAEGTRRELALGDVLNVPRELKSKFTRLQPKPSKGLVSARKRPAVEISDDKRMSILERLKAARRASLQGKKDSDDESQ